MKRIQGFQILALSPQQWMVGNGKKNCQIPADLIAQDCEVVDGWHRCWAQALARFAELHPDISIEESPGAPGQAGPLGRLGQSEQLGQSVNSERSNAASSISDRESMDVVVISAKSRNVLVVFSTSAFAKSFENASRGSSWSSSKVPLPGRDPDQAVYANFNQNKVAWVEMAGASIEIPCHLSFIEQRARHNPDGLYGRFWSRVRELKDYLGKD